MQNVNTNTRWSLVVSTETDIALRQFLASQGGGRKGDLSRFVEEAVRAYIFDSLAAQTKTENANHAQADIEDAIDEALEWARQ